VSWKVDKVYICVLAMKMEINLKMNASSYKLKSIPYVRGLLESVANILN